MRDTLTRFVLDSAPVRGGVIRLDRAYLDAVEAHDYPTNVAEALGELLCATTLLASSLKWEGSFIFQLQSQGALKLLCAEASHTMLVRAVANVEGFVAPTANVFDVMPDARAVLTLDPKGINQNAQMYQGIVNVDPRGMAFTVEDYMLQSQQVRTCVLLAANDHCAAGFFVQKLPGDDAENHEAFERIEALTRTLTPEEMLTLDASTILTRLFHDETVRVLPEQSVRFACSCSPERVLGALRLMGRAEIEDLLEEQGQISARCQFCNRGYQFGRAELATLFAEFPDVPGNTTKH